MGKLEGILVGDSEVPWGEYLKKWSAKNPLKKWHNFPTETKSTSQRALSKLLTKSFLFQSLFCICVQFLNGFLDKHLIESFGKNLIWFMDVCLRYPRIIRRDFRRKFWCYSVKFLWKNPWRISWFQFLEKFVRNS